MKRKEGISYTFSDIDWKIDNCKKSGFGDVVDYFEKDVRYYKLKCSAYEKSLKKHLLFTEKLSSLILKDPIMKEAIHNEMFWMSHPSEK